MIGRIYLLQSPYTDKVYIGSTIQTLRERFRMHKKPSNETSSYLVTDEGDSFIELLEEVKVIDKDELCFYEQQYLELYRDVAVNKKFAFGYLSERDKKYREKVKYKVECPCGSTVIKRGMCDHIKTQKHLKYLENVAQE
jgi:hypothetical protein